MLTTHSVPCVKLGAYTEVDCLTTRNPQRKLLDVRGIREAVHAFPGLDCKVGRTGHKD